MGIRIMNRLGVTLVEVMFAMAVALIGLVGLISILPIAGRRTQNAINLNDSASLAGSVFDNLKARGLLDPSRWVVHYDYQTSNYFAITPSLFDDDAAVLTGTQPALAIHLNDSWCIDPLFVASPNAFDLYDNTNPSNSYRRMLFPYFRAEHNPAVDPSVGGSNWLQGRLTAAGL